MEKNEDGLVSSSEYVKKLNETVQQQENIEGLIRQPYIDRKILALLKNFHENAGQNYSANTIANIISPESVDNRTLATRLAEDLTVITELLGRGLHNENWSGRLLERPVCKKELACVAIITDSSVRKMESFTSEREGYFIKLGTINENKHFNTLYMTAGRNPKEDYEFFIGSFMYGNVDQFFEDKEYRDYTEEFSKE